MHLIDLSQFYVPECRKIQSFLAAKSRWFSGFSHLRHTIIAPACPAASENEEVIRVPGMRLPFFPEFRLISSRKSTEVLIKSMHPDCIEVSDPFRFARIAVNLRQESNILIGAFCHFDPVYLSPWHFLSEKRTLEKLARLYSHFDLVFASSMALTEKLQECGLKRVKHLPPGVDTRVFYPEAMDTTLRCRLGLKEDIRLLACVEYTPGQKNRRVLFEAMQRLNDRYHLLIIGSGTKNINMEKISSFYFHQQTHPPEALATLIASCDILIHPELHQHYPLSIPEAMSCGIPVVGFNSGSFKELVDNRTGISVDAVCPKKLADGIVTAYENDIMKMGNTARQKAREKHDWHDLLARWCTYYISALASKGNYPAKMADLTQTGGTKTS